MKNETFGILCKPPRAVASPPSATPHHPFSYPDAENLELGGAHLSTLKQLVNYALTRFVESQKGISALEKRARRGSTPAFLKALETDRTDSSDPG